MERRNLALLCAGVVCFWLFALAFGTAQGKGLHIQPAVQAQAEPAVQILTVTPPQLTLPCRAAILIDQTSGTVLYEMNADQTMPIASITKVMTLLLTFEAVHAGRLTMDTAVPVSEHAYHMGGSQIWLEPGEHTTFRNACGLDIEGHLSTARDVAIMSRTILNTCPEVLHYTGIWTDTLRGGQTQLVNTNKLLRRYNGITGLKTGTTGGAGVCITASATRDGLDLIAVVLGAPSSKERFEAATTLLDYGFAAYRAAPVPLPEERPLQLKVKGSTEETVPLDYAALPQTALLPAESAGQLTVQLELPEALEAPVTRGQTVGKAQLLCGEALQGEYPVCAAADAPRMDFDTALQLLWDSLRGAAA